jgi:hypothetical protein
MSCSHNCNQGRNCTCRQACELPIDIDQSSPWPLRLVDLLIVICGAALLCWLLGVFGPALDAHASEWPASQALVDAQRAAVREFNKDMAAAKLCRETHGESLVRWTAAGELVCVPRHSKQAQRLASNP